MGLAFGGMGNKHLWPSIPQLSVGSAYAFTPYGLRPYCMDRLEALAT